MSLHFRVKLHKGKYRWLDVYYYWMCSHYFSQFMYCENYGKASWIYFTRCANSLSWEVARKSRNDFWILYAVLAAISLIFPSYTLFTFGFYLELQCFNYDFTIYSMLMLACKGVLIISRYAVFTVFFTLWMPFLLFIPLKDGHWIYLLPLLKEGWIPVLNTVKSTIIAFLSLSLHLSFILISVINHLQKGIVLANLITLFIYLQVTFVSFVYFSPDGITKFYGRLFLLLHRFTSHFLSDLKLSFVILSLYYF